MKYNNFIYFSTADVSIVQKEGDGGKVYREVRAAIMEKVDGC
jgi:hypothetical protein